MVLVKINVEVLSTVGTARVYGKCLNSSFLFEKAPGKRGIRLPGVGCVPPLVYCVAQLVELTLESCRLEAARACDMSKLAKVTSVKKQGAMFAVNVKISLYKKKA